MSILSFFVPSTTRITNKLKFDTFEVDVGASEFLSYPTKQNPDLYETYTQTQTQTLFGKKNKFTTKTFVIKYYDVSISFGFGYLKALSKVSKELWADKLLQFSKNPSSKTINLGEIKGETLAENSTSVLLFGSIAAVICFVLFGVPGGSAYLNDTNFEPKNLASIANIAKDTSIVIDSSGNPVKAVEFVQKTTSGRRFSRTTSYNLEMYILCQQNQSKKSYIVEVSDKELLGASQSNQDLPIEELIQKSNFCTKKSNAISLNSMYKKNEEALNEVLSSAKSKNLEAPIVFYPNNNLFVVDPITKFAYTYGLGILLVIPLFFLWLGKNQKSEVSKKIQSDR